jgi:protein YibB
MHDITIVTAFFDIGRGDKQRFKKIPRSTMQYLSYFERWARIKNRLIVFCGDEVIAREVKHIRENFGLLDNTDVEIIPNVFSLEKGLYDRMRDVAKNKYFLDFRIVKSATSNIAEYDYIMYLKAYFMREAYARFNITTEFLAWLDFGFDHDGTLYPYKEDWSFLWSFEPPDLLNEGTSIMRVKEGIKNDNQDKIHLFYLPPHVDTRPMFEIIRTLQPDSIMGCMFLLPTCLAPRLWEIVKRAVDDLLDFGFIDDDQPVFLLAARRHAELFVLIESRQWFYMVKQTGGAHMRVNQDFLNSDGKTKATAKAIFKKSLALAKKILLNILPYGIVAKSMRRFT